MRTTSNGSNSFKKLENSLFSSAFPEMGPPDRKVVKDSKNSLLLDLTTIDSKKIVFLIEFNLNTQVTKYK